MNEQNKTTLTVENTINVPVEKVWEYWTRPEHIVQWNSASVDWHTPRAENDLRVGGSFTFRMEAKDGSMGFDFGGVYDKITGNELIAFTLGDDRKVAVNFSQVGNSTKVVESFEAENTNSLELQQGGWQAILNSFKQYCERVEGKS